MDQVYLGETTQNVLDALNNLLRVCGRMEDEEWLEKIRKIKSHLETKPYSCKKNL